MHPGSTQLHRDQKYSPPAQSRAHTRSACYEDGFAVCYAAKKGTARTKDEVTEDEAGEDESHRSEQRANSSTKDVRSQSQGPCSLAIAIS